MLKKMKTKGKVFQWNGNQGSWYFLYVDDVLSRKIKKEQEGIQKTRGFGSVKVRVKVGKTIWNTSVFPTKEGPYLLPLKASVRKKEGIFDADTIQVSLEFL